MAINTEKSGTNSNGTLSSTSPESAPADVEAIIRRIKAQVAADIAEERQAFPRYTPPQVETSSSAVLLEAEELKYLNQHWHDWNVAEELSSHRRFIGPLIVKAKRFIVNVTWQYVLKGYLEREKQYQMNLVRFLNSTAKHVDKKDYEIFWQLINKVDADVKALNERMDQLFAALNGSLLEIKESLSGTSIKHTPEQTSAKNS